MISSPAGPTSTTASHISHRVPDFAGAAEEVGLERRDDIPIEEIGQRIEAEHIGGEDRSREQGLASAWKAQSKVLGDRPACAPDGERQHGDLGHG